MNKDEIIEKLQETVDNIFFLIKEVTVNKISDKIDFVIANVEKNEYKNPEHKDNSLKLLRSHKYSFDEVVEVVFSKEKYISWVDLFVLISDKHETVICVTLVKSNKYNEDINFHCGVILPDNYIEGEKFDLNKRLFDNQL